MGTVQKLVAGSAGVLLGLSTTGVADASDITEVAQVNQSVVNAVDDEPPRNQYNPNTYDLGSIRTNMVNGVVDVSWDAAPISGLTVT